MPLFFYLPMIIWMGLFGITHEDACVPVRVKAKR
jgi:hypothetical protein